MIGNGWLRTMGLVLLLGSGAGCGEGEDDSCVSGEVVPCSCSAVESGLRFCQEDLRLGECLCGEALAEFDDDSVRDQGKAMATDGGSRSQQRDLQDPREPAELPAGAKRLFVTSARFSGRLWEYAQGGELRVGEVADALCDQAARAADLGGQWQAWLSTRGEEGYIGGRDAVDRIGGSGPWYALDGQKVFNNKDNLATVPLAPLGIDEWGRRDGFGWAWIWTGTRSGGRAATDTCQDWSREDPGFYGEVGWLGSTSSSWTADSTASCDEEHHLLCLEL